MSVNPLTRNLSYFAKHRELPGVPKQPFTPHHREGILDMVDCDFRLAQQKDNGPDDLDPGQGRVLVKWPDGMTSASYSEDKSGRHLERTTVMGGGRSVTQIHQAVEGLDYLACYSFPGQPDTMTCYHADFANPQNDFYQQANLGPAPPTGGPFPNCNRLGLR